MGTEEYHTNNLTTVIDPLTEHYRFGCATLCNQLECCVLYYKLRNTVYCKKSAIITTEHNMKHTNSLSNLC